MAAASSSSSAALSTNLDHPFKLFLQLILSYRPAASICERQLLWLPPNGLVIVSQQQCSSITAVPDMLLLHCSAADLVCDQHPRRVQEPSLRHIHHLWRGKDRGPVSSSTGRDSGRGSSTCRRQQGEAAVGGCGALCLCSSSAGFSNMQCRQVVQHCERCSLLLCYHAGNKPNE